MRPTARSLPIFLLMLSVVVGVAVPLAAAEEQPFNFAKNPGFEIPWLQEDDGLLSLHGGILGPTYWWPRHAIPTKEALYKWDLATTYSGSCCVSVNTRRQDPAFPLYEAWSQFVDARDLAGSTLTVRAMVKKESPNDSTFVEFRIHAFRDGIAVGDPCGASSRMESDASEWTEHTLTFVVPDEADRLIVQLGLLGIGTAWFDEVALIIDNEAAPSRTAWSSDLADPRLIFVMDSAGVLREPVTAPEAPLARKPWNILMYAAADFWNAYTPLEDFASHVQSNRHVNVLILEDHSGPDAAIWVVDRPGYSVRLTPVQDLGETHMDEPEALERFLEFAEQWFPAERTLLFFYGHGHAWWGACNDQSNDSETEGTAPCDWLSPAEMRTALETVDGVDAVMFSAPCVMSSLEAAYEVREVTELYVASEEVSGYAFWREAVAPIAVSLFQNPAQNVATLGQTAIDCIRDTVQIMIDSGARYVPHQPTIAATLTCNLPKLAQVLDAFALALIAALPKHRAAIAAARDASTDFVYGELVDTYSFAKGCQRIPGLGVAATDVMHEIDETVIAQVANTVKGGEAHGLSLYFPVLDVDAPGSVLELAFEVTGETYLNYGLSLLADTHWHQFLEAFFATQASP